MTSEQENYWRANWIASLSPERQARVHEFAEALRAGRKIVETLDGSCKVVWLYYPLPLEDLAYYIESREYMMRNFRMEIVE